MRYVKTFGLVVAAALALMAMAGAGSASAGVICTENKTPCPMGHPTGKMYVPGDVIKLTSSGPGVTSSPQFGCEHSEIKKELLTTGGRFLNPRFRIVEATYKNCEAELFGGISCTATAVGLPWEGEVSGSGAGASVTISKPRISFVCGGFLSCTFGRALIHLAITGGSPATVNASEEELEIESGGFGCPEEAFLDADYKTTTGGLFVVSE